jgi:hypothetical protein
MFDCDLRRLAYSVYRQGYREDWSLRRFDYQWLAECKPQTLGNGSDTLALQLLSTFGWPVTVTVIFNGSVCNPGGEYLSWSPWGWAHDAVFLLRQGRQP